MAELALGTGMIGGATRRFEQDEANRIFDAAWENGIRHFDTAALYGAGRALELLGMWIKTRNVPRKEIFVSTKIARTLSDPTEQQPFDNLSPVGGARRNQTLDYSYRGALTQIRQATDLAQLGYFDALLLHDVDMQNHGDDYPALLEIALNGSWQALVEAKRKGITKSIGLGVNNWEPCATFINRGCELDCVLIAGRYTLLEQGALDFLNVAYARKIKVFLGGNLNSGVLVEGVVEGARYNYKPVEDAWVIERVGQLKAFCDAQAVPLPAAALQFAGAHPAVCSVVLGPNRIEDLYEDIEWYRALMRPEFWDTLRKNGLINLRAPMPRSSDKKPDTYTISRQP